MIPNHYPNNSSKKLCWNGINCCYLKNGTCHFYHPPEHYQADQYQFADDDSWEQRDYKFFEKSSQKQSNKKFEEGQTFTQNNKLIKLIPIQTNLTCESKAWFFKKARHFEQYHGSKYEDCSICLQNFEKNKLISKLYCDHAFHKQCIQKWLQSCEKCPLCKQNFTDHKQYKKIPWYTMHKQKLQNFHNVNYSQDSYSWGSDQYGEDQLFGLEQGQHLYLGEPLAVQSGQNQYQVQISSPQNSWFAQDEYSIQDDFAQHEINQQDLYDIIYGQYSGQQYDDNDYYD